MNVRIEVCLQYTYHKRTLCISLVIVMVYISVDLEVPSLVDTISDIKGYSKREIKNAERVDALIKATGNPPQANLKILVRS